jgi:Fe-S cluster assembly protein SufD
MMTSQTSTETYSGSGATARADYLAGLLNLRQPLDTNAGWWPNELRDRATAHVRELAIPSSRDEEWRFTNLAGLLQTQFQAVDQQPLLSFAEIEPFILPEAVNSRLVFVNGIYDPALSSVSDLPDGVIVTNLATALELEAINDGIVNLLNPLPGAEEVFTALNTASMTDAAIVWVYNKQEIEIPIQILYVSTATQPTLVHPRCYVMAQDFSKLTLIEEFVSLNEGVYFTNSVTEIHVWPNAAVDHIRIQRESENAFHIGKTAVSQEHDSHYACHAVNLGGKLSRHNLEVYQTGSQTETVMDGLTIARHEQLSDTHSILALTQPYGTSQQIHKCIVDDRAHAVFNGKIFVPKAAQQTNAEQVNRNLLLSPKARVDTKPQLEIVADNVRCTHGATVGQLEADEVFYLQSRGIDADTARRLLTTAFAYEIIDRIPISSLRASLGQLISP